MAVRKQYRTYNCLPLPFSRLSSSHMFSLPFWGPQPQYSTGRRRDDIQDDSDRTSGALSVGIGVGVPDVRCERRRARGMHGLGTALDTAPETISYSSLSSSCVVSWCPKEAYPERRTVQEMLLVSFRWLSCGCSGWFVLIDVVETSPHTVSTG